MAYMTGKGLVYCQLVSETQTLFCHIFSSLLRTKKAGMRTQTQNQLEVRVHNAYLQAHVSFLINSEVIRKHIHPFLLNNINQGQQLKYTNSNRLCQQSQWYLIIYNFIEWQDCRGGAGLERI
jgi:hypothetical protein